jgi:exodeoxyribonuclease VII large subunit
MNREDDLDVVILTRGGGSLEELWPFNEEAVARAIYASRAPVVSAVGHETDFTIADLVADTRAPTPSAAAELVVPDSDELAEGILFRRTNLFQQMSGDLAARGQRMDQAVWRLERNTPDIPSWRQRVDDLSREYWQALESHLSVRVERTRTLESRLASLSPNNVLARGYAVVQRRDNSELVTSVSQVDPGDDIQVNVKDGSFPARTLSRNP